VNLTRVKHISKNPENSLPFLLNKSSFAMPIAGQNFYEIFKFRLCSKNEETRETIASLSNICFIFIDI